MSEKVKMDYIIGEHPEIKGRVVIAIDGSGIDMENKEHVHYMDVVAKSIAPEMYAFAHGLKIDRSED